MNVTKVLYVVWVGIKSEFLASTPGSAIENMSLHKRYSWVTRRFSCDVIAAMLMEEKKNISLVSFLRPTEVVHFSIVIIVSRGWLKTSYFGSTITYALKNVQQLD